MHAMQSPGRSSGASPDEHVAADLETYREQIAQFLGAGIRRFHVPGAVVEILANGYRLAAAAGGAVTNVAPMSGETRFLIGRAYRFLVSLVILDLLERGGLAMEARLARYLPELEGSPFGESVSLRHLLGESCGFRPARGSDLDILRKHSWGACFQSLRDAQPLFEPGSVASPLLEGWALTAEIVGRTVGEPLSHLVAATLRKLGVDADLAFGDSMVNAAVAHLRDPRSGRVHPISPFQLASFWQPALPDVRLSAAELMAVVEHVLTAREGLGGARIDQRVAAGMQAQLVHVPPIPSGADSEALPLSLGAGVHEFRPGWFGLNGPPFGQSFCFRYHGTRRFAVVVGANSNAPALCDFVFAEILRSLGADASPAEPCEIAQFHRADELAGTYVGTSGEDVCVRIDGDHLVCEAGGTRPMTVRFQQELDGRWRPKPAPAPWTLGFFRAGAGEPCLSVDGIAYKKNSPPGI